MGKISDYYSGLNLRDKKAFRVHIADSVGNQLCGLNSIPVKRMLLADWLRDTKFRKCSICEKKYEMRMQLLEWRTE